MGTLDSKKKSNKVSITTIIPFYNSENTLSKLLDSILQGTVVPEEILLIDDGSCDNSVNIAKTYADNYECINYLYKEHGGVSAARNYGISKATSEWISFLDADDYIEPDMYKLMIDAVENQEYDCCICGYFKHYQNTISEYANFQNEYMNSSDMLKAMFEDQSILGYLCTRLFRADKVKAFKFDENIGFSEDLLFQTQFFESAIMKIATIPKPLYHYVLSETSATSTRKQFKDGIYIYKPAFEKLYMILNENYVWDNYNSLLQRSMYNSLINYKNNNSKDLLSEIRMLQNELKRTPCLKKTRRRIAYEVAPILYSLFL